MPGLTKDKTLREQLAALERLAAEYERVAGKPVGDDLMLGTFFRCLPQNIRQHILANDRVNFVLCSAGLCVVTHLPQPPPPAPKDPSINPYAL